MLFLEDGRIDKEEQAQLDKIYELIKMLKAHIKQEVQKLSAKEQEKNRQDTIQEAKADAASTKDDVVIEQLLDKKCLAEFKSNKLGQFCCFSRRVSQEDNNYQ